MARDSTWFTDDIEYPCLTARIIMTIAHLQYAKLVTVLLGMCPIKICQIR